MKKTTSKNNNKNSHLPGPGNSTEASKNYEDPVGSKDDIGTPKNSGYDEKQPAPPPKKK